MRFLHLLLVLIFTYAVSAGENDRYLSLPNPEKCKSRFKEFQYDGRNYFYSGHDKDLKDAKLDWLDARNTCRERCMETVSLETQAEFDFIKAYIEKNDIKFVWTSGRLCDFAGCEGRWDLLPKIVKGWLWSANQKQIDDTNKVPTGWTYTPWSKTGHFKRKQPDNAEFYINQASESCLGVLNNKYNDSVAWHDIACYHKTGFICEDSAELINEAQEIKEGSETSEEIIMAPPTKIETTRVESTSQKSRELSGERQIGTTKSYRPATTTTRNILTETEKSTTTTERKTTVTSREIIKTTTTRPTKAAKDTTPEFLLSTVTSRFRGGRTRTTLKQEVLPTATKSQRKTLTESTTVEPDDIEPEIVTESEREEMIENVSIPELILNMEEIMPLVASPPEKVEEVTSTTRRPFLKRKRPTARVEKPKEVENSSQEPVVSNARRFLLRKKEPATQQVLTNARAPIPSIRTSEAEKQSVKKEEITEPVVTSTIEPSLTKKYSFKRKKIYNKLVTGLASSTTTEEPVVTSEASPKKSVESSSESKVIVDGDQSELQNIEDSTISEILTTQATTTEEPDEPTRAIPIKRKKVKIYRKVIKLRTSTERADDYDGQLQDIDIDSYHKPYVPTVGPPVVIRKNLFNPRFRPASSRLKLHQTQNSE